jgi:hypothetical protein
VVSFCFLVSTLLSYMHPTSPSILHISLIVFVQTFSLCPYVTRSSAFNIPLDMQYWHFQLVPNSLK